MNERKNPNDPDPYDRPLLERLRERSSWILIILGAIVVFAFFNWWVQRDDVETYTLAPGLTEPAPRVSPGRSIPTDRVEPDPRRPTPLSYEGEVATVIGTQIDIPDSELTEILGRSATELSGEEVHVKARVIEIIGPNVLIVGTQEDRGGVIVFYQAQDLRGMAPAVGQEISVYGSITPVHPESARQWLGARYTDMEPRLAEWEGRLSIVASQAH